MKRKKRKMNDLIEYLEQFPTGPDTDVTQQAVITFNFGTPNVNLHKKGEGSAGAFPGRVTDFSMCIRPAQALFFIKKKVPLENRYKKKRSYGGPTAIISTFNGLPQFGADDFEIRDQVIFAGYPKVTWIPGLETGKSHTASHIALQSGGSGSTENNSNVPLHVGDAFTYEYPSLNPEERARQYAHLHTLNDMEKNFVPIVRAFDPVQESKNMVQKILKVAMLNSGMVRPNIIQDAIYDRKLDEQAMRTQIPKHMLIAGADMHRFASTAFLNSIRLAIDVGLVSIVPNPTIDNRGHAADKDTQDFLVDLATNLSLINPDDPKNLTEDPKFLKIRNRILLETFTASYLRHPVLARQAKMYISQQMCAGLTPTGNGSYSRAIFDVGPRTITPAKKLMDVFSNASSDFMGTLFYLFVSSYDKKVGTVLKGAPPGGKFDYKIGQ